MIYELMHINTVAAEVEIDADGNIKKLVSIIAENHFPFGTEPKGKTKDPTGLLRWWNNRRIPISRDDLEALKGIRLPESATPGRILLACKGLSLSDSYWIREKGSVETFENINFFANGFSYDLGDVLVGKKKEGDFLFFSPDGSSEGNLKKRWKIFNGQRILLKSGTPPYRYEIYNEVIASDALKHLGIPHVDYFIMEDDKDIYCACPDFVGYSQDFVTAYMIHEAEMKRNDESEYGYLVRRYKELGVDEAKRAIDVMLLFDYLIGNEDRHLNNFGLLRDAKTLEFLGPAPIFDSGSSLGFRFDDDQLRHAGASPWKPFPTRAKPTQLDYVDVFPFASADALFSLPEAIAASCVSLFPRLPRQRAKAIVGYVSNRVAEVAAKYGLVPSPKAFMLTPSERSLLDYIHSRGGTLPLAQDAVDALGLSRITVLRSLKTLTEQGYLTRVGPRKTGYWKAR